MASRFFVLGLLFGICSVTLASDPSPLQDFCVADSTSSDWEVHVNGKVCKGPNLVEAEDFVFSGLHIAGNTSTTSGNIRTKAIIPGFNTLGISMAHGDFAPSGFSSPRVHPRASEMVLVLEGRLEVGFVTSNPVDGVPPSGRCFHLPTRSCTFPEKCKRSCCYAFSF